MERYLELLSKQSLELIKGKKNLLAFSAGIDSTALFFLLVEAGIDFDIAIVDYNIREQSKKELEYAQSIANNLNKKIFIKSVKIDESNFEKNARDIRYKFFEEIIKKYNYNNLITAHQLNDRLEWFLMQLTHGAGLVEIMGYEEISLRDYYQLIRPLINSDKESLKEYLESNDIEYFIDNSNFDKKYMRNFIRAEFSDKLILKYKNGIKNSFKYLNEDKKYIMDSGKVFFKIDELYVLKRDFNELRVVDKILKKSGYLLSHKQREEIKKLDELVINDRFTISKTKEFIYISPFVNDSMPKDFKDRCRVLKIPIKIRPYLYKQDINPAYFAATLLDNLSAKRT